MTSTAGRWSRWLLPLGLAGVALATGSLASTSGGFQRFRIPSESMAPALRSGEQFIARTTSLLPIARGSVYVVRKGREVRVFRVIGLPGDTLEIIGGGVFLNDKSAYYSDDNITGATGTCSRGLPLFRREHLPGGASHVIMACDYGFGRDMPVILVPAHHYFLLGDNRSNAADSRFAGRDFGVGLVPETDFVGKAERLFFSSDSARIGKAID